MIFPAESALRSSILVHKCGLLAVSAWRYTLSATLQGYKSHPLRSHPSYLSNPSFFPKSSPANTMTPRERVQICGTQTLSPSVVLHLFCAPLHSFIVPFTPFFHTNNSFCLQRTEHMHVDPLWLTLSQTSQRVQAVNPVGTPCGVSLTQGLVGAEAHKPINHGLGVKTLRQISCPQVLHSILSFPGICLLFAAFPTPLSLSSECICFIHHMELNSSLGLCFGFKTLGN